MNQVVLYLFFIPSFIMFTSCNTTADNKEMNGGNSAISGSINEQEKMLANNEKVNRAIETGNFEGIDTLWAEDIVNHSGPDGKEIRGRDSVKSSLMQISKVMKNIKIETKASSYNPESGYLFSLTHFTATTVVPMNGMPANSNIDMNSVDVVKIKDGKAVEHWIYEDPNVIMKMMTGMQKQK